MNPKNTLLLLITLGLLVLGLYVLRTRPPKTTSTDQAAPALGGSGTTLDVLEEQLGEVEKVVVRRRDEPEWVFEKIAEGDGPAAWHMTAPSRFKAVSWEVEKLPRQLGSLRYDISYAPGEAGVTLESAGLDPPRAVVTLIDADGTRSGVEIGGPAGERETYVRPTDGDRICVGKSSLADLLKSKPVQYREKLLWTFNPEDAVRLEVTERSGRSGETTYIFTRDGARWVIEAPVTARATAKVDEALKAMSRLRVTQWQADDPDRPATYGLDQPQLTARVTLEEEVEIKPEPEADKPSEGGEASEDAASEDEPATGLQSRTLMLHVSDRAPIGEETKVYVRPGESPAVATIMKTTIDKLRPDMDAWRDMHVTPVDTTASTSLSLELPGGSFEAARAGTQWRRVPDDAALDTSAVSELLATLRDLTAATFVDDGQATGFDNPQASIHVTVPGVEGGERITVGSYTDTTSRRLVYVRRGPGGPVAKVRTSDVEPLLREPVAYLDRTVLDLIRSGMSSVSIKSTNEITGAPQTLRFERDADVWIMAAPIRRELAPESFGDLVSTLANLRATRVVAESDQRTAFGLQEPDVVVTIEYGKPVVDPEVKAEPQQIELSVASHDGRYFAKRASAPLIYEVDPALFDKLREEYVTDRVWTFEQEDVAGFTITSPEVTHGFDRQGAAWVYRAEPDLPLDTKSVEDLLLRLRDLRAVRHVDYARMEPGAYGLDSPQRTVTVKTADGSSRTLAIAETPELGGRPVGMVLGRPGVVAMEPNVLERCAVDLDALESAD